MTDQMCRVEGCERTTHARGLCGMHYLRWWLHGDPSRNEDSPRGRSRRSVDERFWAQVEKSDECWLWNGLILSNGYGQIKTPLGKKSVHRLSWEMHRGPIPRGMFVCHRCDVRECVNPDHLFLGTAADNNRDMREKLRHVRGDRVRGSRLTPQQAAEIRASDEPRSVLAERYGVSGTSIRNIKARKTWAWIK